MPIIWTLLQAAWIVAFVASAVFTIRFVYRRSKLLGAILIAGAFVHALVPAIFFSISWFNLPVLRELHTGDGFWVIAPDARTYFALASKAAAEGLHTIPYGSPSPSFVQAIAVWMDLVGVSPGSPLFFNLIAYIATCGLIVRLGMSGEESTSPNALAWPLITLSFSPTLLLCSAQVLKDVFFACLTAVVALSAREILTRFDHRLELRPSAAALLGGVIGLCLGMYAIAGLRAYYGVFIWLSLAATLGLFLFRQRRAQLARYMSLATAMLVVLWLAFMTGAGAYYPYYHNVAVGGVNTMTAGLVTKITERFATPAPTGVVPTTAPAADPGATIDALREGFVLSAGNTNLIRRPAAPPPAAVTPGDTTKPVAPTGPSRFDRIMERVRGTVLGLVAMFVPTTLLQALSVVDIQGGRGFLYVTDLDTLFIDFSIIGIGWLLIRERRSLRHRQVYLFFCLTIALLSTILLAYVVTNLGTLFRLRLIALVPFWMAPLAIGRATQAITVTANSRAKEAQSAWQPATSGADL